HNASGGAIVYNAQPGASAARIRSRPSAHLPPMSLIRVPVSFGELIDKITILEIKAAHIRDAAKLANVRTELDLLDSTWAQNAASRVDIADERARLKAVNEDLWDI